MECLLAIGIYLAGGLGVQDYKHLETANSYDLMIGELTLTASSCAGYIELKHVSGINTGEADAGINALMTGLNYSKHNITIKTGIGMQPVFEDIKTNDYGMIIAEASIMYEWEGLFVKAEKLDEMSMISAGFIKRF